MLARDAVEALARQVKVVKARDDAPLPAVRVKERLESAYERRLAAALHALQTDAERRRICGARVELLAQPKVDGQVIPVHARIVRRRRRAKALKEPPGERRPALAGDVRGGHNATLGGERPADDEGWVEPGRRHGHVCDDCDDHQFHQHHPVIARRPFARAWTFPVRFDARARGVCVRGALDRPRLGVCARAPDVSCLLYTSPSPRD